MARTALPYSSLLVNGSLADPTGVAAVAGVGNGVSIPDVSPNRRLSSPELTLLRVVCGATGGNAVVKAGALPLAPAAGQGDLTVALTAAQVVWIGPFDSGRFVQNTGELVVETTQAMTVTAFNVRRH